MTFNTTENSNAAGSPILLYEFQRDDTYWRYAGSDEPFALGADTYVAANITSDAMVQSGDKNADEFKITGSILLPIVQAFLNVPPSGQVNVRVRRAHEGESEAAVVWVGLLDRVRPNNEVSADLICKHLLATLDRTGLRLAWTRGCLHMWAGPDCKVDKEAFKRTATVLSVSGSVVTAPGLAGTPVGVLHGGWLQWTNTDGFVERRTIIEDNDGMVTLLGGTSGLEAGMSVVAYFGCPHTGDACQNIFDNLANYGGYEHLPGRSPFDGNPVF